MRTIVARVWAGFALAMVVGCGGGDAGDDDDNDVMTEDAGMQTPDAAVPPTPDAAVPAPPPVEQLVPGAKRLTGGGYTMDAQLGHWVSQQPASGGGTSLEGASAIKE